MFFFNKNDFDLNQKHLQVFQTFRLLKKNMKETSGETQKASSFCFVFLVSPDLKKGENQNYNNYRPITLISNITKLKEKLL